MIIYKKNDCSCIEIKSDLITNFDGNQTLTLLVKDVVAGTTTETAISLTDIDNNTYTYTPATGVYNISLRSVEGSVTTFDSKCLFFDCDIVCNALRVSEMTTRLLYALEAYEVYNCDCDHMKEIYEALQSQITEENDCAECL